MSRYPLLNSTFIENNTMGLFVYANQVTNNFFGLFVVVSFYFVVLLGSLMLQYRFSGDRLRPDLSFLASSFSTLGFAVILQSYSGILSPIYFFVLVGLTILSFIWVSINR